MQLWQIAAIAGFLLRKEYYINWLAKRQSFYCDLSNKRNNNTFCGWKAQQICNWQIKWRNCNSQEPNIHTETVYFLYERTCLLEFQKYTRTTRTICRYVGESTFTISFFNAISAIHFDFVVRLQLWCPIRIRPAWQIALPSHAMTQSNEIAPTRMN